MSQWVGFVSGAGILPTLSAVSRLLAQPSTSRVSIFYERDGSADAGDLADGLEQLLLLKDRNMARLSLGIVMEREPDEAPLLTGRLDAEKIRTLAGRLFEPGAAREYFICGPETFVAEARSALSGTGVPPAQIHVERADGDARSADEDAPSPDEAKPVANEHETQVSFVMDGRRRSFTMRRDEESILEAADRAGIELPFSCKAGVCATCRTKLVKGKVDLVENHALEDWELEQGFILACQARARTPEIELTYDEK
jgi:ring-1,2-phenylacetyl-CoA epoxidase subunit PaaE